MNEMFNIESEFQTFLKLIGLDQSKMPENQIQTMRDTFFAAYGQCMITLRDKVPEDENQAVEVLEDMLLQCEKYWESRTKKPKINEN